jgi:hypothetical protein
MSGFEFPQTYVGCPVQISSDPSESDKTLGWVFQLGNGAVGVLSIAGKQHFDCWHADDPRCITQSNVFQDFDDRGVFRLTEGEIQRRQLHARMATLEGRLAELELELRELGPKHEQPPKRRSSRASRPEPVEA